MIKFGIIIDKFNIEDWKIDCINYMRKLSDFELILLILAKDKSKLKKKGLNSKNVFFKHILTKLNYLRKRNLKEYLGREKILNCYYIKKDNLYFFIDNYLRSILSYNLDFILNLTHIEFGGKILESLKFGLWSFKNCHEIELFKLFSLKSNLISIRLISCYKNNDEIITLREAFFPLEKICNLDGLNIIHTIIAKWPFQICLNLKKNRFLNYLEFKKEKNSKAITFPKKKLFIHFFLKLLLIRLRRLYIFLLRHDKWKVSLIKNKIQNIYLNGIKLNEIEWIPAPEKNFFYADPFGLNYKNMNIIIFEKFNYKDAKGVISLFFQFDPKNNNHQFIGPKDVIKKKYHLSYPFIFKFEENLFCLPEISKSNNIQLFKCIDFPLEWKKEKILVKNFSAIDPTIIYFKNQWWLFCSGGNLPNSSLYIFYSSNLYGPWFAHFKNPVKLDLRSSRPAGTPFYFNDNLIRPAQDCSSEYGKKIIFNRIDILDKDSFHETPVKSLSFKKKFSGIHTISSMGNFTLIDVRNYIFSYKLFKKRLISLLFIILKLLRNYVKKYIHI